MTGFGTSHRRARSARRGERIVMLLENNPYPQDVRVRSEAESLIAVGHSVVVVAPRGLGQPARERVRGVDVRRFRMLESRGGAAGFLAEYLVAGLALHVAAVQELLNGATVLHLHNPPDILFPAGALYRIAGRRVVFDHHDLFPETVEDKFDRRQLAFAARVAERLTFAVANHVLATNESYAEIARGRGRKATEAVTVVRNAPPDSWARLALHVRPGPLASIRLAYLGAIATQDGVDALAPVLARLHAQGVDATLTIIGDGDARAQLDSALARLGVADRVTITGWIEWDDVPALLQKADVCVDPAPATEVNQRSTMIKIAEYLALGKPVVAFDLVETRRTASDAALLVPAGDINGFADQIAALARNPQLRSRLAHAARRRAEDLVWRHSECALLSAYAQLRGSAR